MSKRVKRQVAALGLWRGLSFYARSKYGFGLMRATPPGMDQALFLRSRTSDYRVFDTVFLQGHYDIPIDFTPRVIVDAGANVGYASVFFAHRYPDARVLAIEPDDSNFEVLRQNAALFPNIEVLKGGLWSHDTNLRIANPDAAKWSFQLQELDAPAADTVAAYGVETLMARYDLERICILKVDIEGSELALLSAPNVHAWLPRVRQLVIELHDRPGFPPGIPAAFEAAIGPYAHSRRKQGENVIIDFDGSSAPSGAASSAPGA